MAQHAPLRRYYHLFFKLSSCNHPTMAEILDYMRENDFEVSQRTIQRDLDILKNEFKINIGITNDYRYYIKNDEKDRVTDNFKRFLEIINNADVLMNVLLKEKGLMQYLSFGNNTEFKGIQWRTCTKSHSK